MVTHEAFSEMDRAKILYNHVYFSNLPMHCIEDLVREGDFLDVIRHPNYTPRAVEQFIDRDFGREESKKGGFAKGFQRYLSDPFEYWIEAVEKQSDTAKLILFILAISNPPMMREDLYETLKACIGHATGLGILIDATRVDETLKELDRTFVITKDYYGREIQIDFQNPSLVDVMIRYLNSKMDSWGEILLKSARFFNQLDFAFTMEKEEYYGEGYLEYDHDSAGKKSHLETTMRRFFVRVCCPTWRRSGLLPLILAATANIHEIAGLGKR